MAGAPEGRHWGEGRRASCTLSRLPLKLRHVSDTWPDHERVVATTHGHRKDEVQLEPPSFRSHGSFAGWV